MSKIQQTPLLELELLKTLVAIADTGNFSSAAGFNADKATGRNGGQAIVYARFARCVSDRGGRSAA